MEQMTDTSDLSGAKSKDNRTRDFFLSYQWCLNPILTFSELLTHLREEAAHFVEYDTDARDPRLEWRREESRVNIYLFSCAIACTLADYLYKRPWHLAPLAKLYPSMSGLILKAESALNFPSEVKSLFKYRKLRKLQREWDGVVEQVCRLLVLPESEDSEDEKTHGMSGADSVRMCMDGMAKFRAQKLPAALLNARMKLNEGYRCQDLTHHDVVTLATRFLETSPDKKSKFVILSPRTAGSYLAPLLKVYLEHHGLSNISWMTLRPKFGLGKLEKRLLRRLLNRDVNALLIDDYSNTGNTFRMMEKVVRSFGVLPAKIAVLAPVHAVVDSRNAMRMNSGRVNPLHGREETGAFLSLGKETKVIAVHHDDLYLTKLMKPHSVEIFLKEFFSGSDVEDIAIHENWEVEHINKELWSHYPDSFQVRLKRVYEISIHKKNESVETKRILAKSVGLGWLGYHAYLAGEKLHGFVPEIVGLRSGILFMEWVDGRPLPEKKLSDVFLNRMSSYLACRTKTLPLNEDPRARRPYLGWGWLEILSILRRAYNNLLGYLKYDYLLSRLRKALQSKPALVDGRMRPGEWLLCHGAGSSNAPSGDGHDRILKIDFEHHNFGAPELDVVDPAYDIAIASFEFQLTGGQEARIESRYSEESGDKNTLAERVFLYKLLYATEEADRCHHRIMEHGTKNASLELNRRIQWSWDFRIFTMNKFCASLLKKDETVSVLSGIFFMDFDGVFDAEILGFPHTTISGLKAISLLRSNGYLVVPNTGRSCRHVKNYCTTYGFNAGIGEYGSVIVDVVHEKEISLINDEVADEISRCRKILEDIDGVFVDLNYRYSVRAFRYDSRGTRGLERTESRKILKEYDLGKLRAITRGADTYFVGKATNKGEAIEYFKNHIGYSGDSIIAIGDSDEDVAMIENVTLGFAPRNCSEGIRRMSKRGKCTIVSHPAQRGLLHVAERIAGTNGTRADSLKPKDVTAKFFNYYDENSFQHLMVQLLSIADAPRYKRIISIFV